MSISGPRLKGEVGDALGRTVGGINNENRVKQLKKEVAVRTLIDEYNREANSWSGETSTQDTQNVDST